MRLKHFLSVFLTLLTLSVGQMWGTATTVKWARVTSISTLTGGGTFIMGYEATAKSGTIIPLRSKDCNATTSANGYFNTGTTSGSSTSGTIDMSTVTSTSDYEVYISSPASGKINIQRATSSGNYYGATSGGTTSNKARLYTSGNSNETNLTPEWASETNNQFKLTAGVSGSYKYLKYNTGNPRFAYYNSAGEKIVFYKKVTLSSISVRTAPTKTSYAEGESFAPAGLVIRKTWSDNSTEDITYNNTTASDFTFSPSTSTTLTTSNTSVTITYGGKSTSQSITVAASGCDNKVTLATGNPSNGTISFSPTGPVETCDGNVNVTMTITPNAGYYLSAYSPTGVNTSNTPSITTGTSAKTAQTPTLTFAQNSNGTYTAGATFTAFVDHFIDEVQSTTGYTGAGMAKSGNYSNSLPTITDKTTATSGTCEEQHYHFCGWVTEANRANPHGHLATIDGTATGTTYYAVWAKQGAGGGSHTISIDGTGLQAVVSNITSGYSQKTITIGGYNCTASAVTKSTQSNTNGWLQLKKNNEYILIPELPAAITNISSTSVKNASNGSVSTGVYFNSSATTSQAIASQTLSNATSFSLDISGNAKGGYFLVGAATCINQLSITYGVDSYADSISVCCQELGQINGSVTMSQTSATLEWADLGHVSSWAVKYKTHAASNWSDWSGEHATANSKRSVTITNLSCGTAYDFKIAATAASGYCDAEQVIEDQSTTKWNITYTLSGTVNLDEGPAQGANACGEIMATFTKNDSYTFPDEITVTIGGAEASAGTDYEWDADNGELYIDESHVSGAIVVAIAGVAPTNPSVTPNPAALSFTSVKKGAAVPAAQDIALVGHNLTAALTVTSSNESLYKVSVKSGSLTPDGNKDASPVITVTPQAGITSTAGDKNATITISGGGLASAVVVNITFNVQETYTVNWWINGGENPASSQIDVEGTEVTAPTYPDDFSDFTDCISELHFIGWATSAIAGGSDDEKPELVTPITAIGTANVNYYAVFAEGTPASTETIFEESLSSGISTTGWTFNGKCYTLNSAVRMSTGSDPGVMTSPAISTLDGDATLTFEVKAWSSTENGKVTLSASKGTLGTTNFTTSSSDDFEEVSSTLSGGNATTTITFTGTAGYRISIKNVKATKTIAENFSKYYTTCPHVSRVNLSAAYSTTPANGTISFKVGGSAVTSPSTADGDVEVEIIASPNPGYELTGVSLSSLSGASYNSTSGKIELEEDAEGDLIVTATFGQKNYSIAVETYPASIGATLSGATTTAKYGVEQTISTNEPTGYIFGGWYMYDAEDTEKENDLSSDLFTGTYEGGDLELEASFLMPEKNLVAEAYFDEIHNVAWALENTPSSGSSEKVYVKGLISKIDSYQNNTITYWISDNGQHVTGSVLEVYKGKGVDNANFTVKGNLTLGDEVIVYGQLKNFNGTKEFDQGNYLYSRTAATLSSLAIVGDASVTTYDVGDSFDKTGLSLTATYNTGYVVTNYTGTTITSNYDAPTTFTAGVTKVVVSASEGLINTSRDIAVTVSNAVLDHVVIAADAKTEFWAKEQYKEPLLDAYLTDESVMHNVTGESNTTGLDMSVAGNDKSVTVTYTRKAGQEASTTYNFTVKPVAVDEANAHSVATALEIIDLDNDASEDLGLALDATKTHVKGVVTSVTALTGNNEGKYTIVIKDQTDAAKVMTLYQVTLKSGISSVAVNDLIKAYGNLYYHSQSSKYEINTGGQVVWKQPKVDIQIANKTLEVGDVWTIDATIDPAAAPVTYSIKSGSDACITLATNVITATAVGTATIIAHADAYEEYLGNEKEFTVTVKPAAVHTNVVLYAEYDGHYYALNNAAGATEIELCGGKVVVADGDTKNAIVWDRAVKDGVATFYNATAQKYLNGSGSTTLSVAASEGTYTSWTWDATNGYYYAGTASTRTFLYREYTNSQSQLMKVFQNYAANNAGNADDGYSNLPVIYTGEVVIGTIEVIRDGLDEGKWGTYCPVNGLKAVEGASFYTITYVEKHSNVPYKVFFDEIEGGSLTAGQPYVFIAEGEEIKGVKDNTVASEGQHNDHGFIGYTNTENDDAYTFNVSQDDVDAHKYYIVKDNAIRLCGTGWFGIRSERAFINMSAVSTNAVAPAPGRRRVSLSNPDAAPHVATGIDDINEASKAVKVIINDQLYIIRNGRLYDTTGRFVEEIQ